MRTNLNLTGLRQEADTRYIRATISNLKRENSNLAMSRKMGSARWTGGGARSGRGGRPVGGTGGEPEPCAARAQVHGTVQVAAGRPAEGRRDGDAVMGKTRAASMFHSGGQTFPGTTS